jgi:polar amino acid transport system substrate-binding protein
MQQLTQKLKSGQMRIIDAPIPALQKGYVLVRNYYSLISSGTEASTVKAARKGYIGKAIERPQQVKQVIDTLKTRGPVQTYRTVMNKLDAFSPLGYSCSGEVIDVSPDTKDFRVGDLVACSGLTASHSEVVSVPVNLCAKLKPDADLKQAAFNTLGAIALQGVRQADLKIGESCAVIGLGLLGQLTTLLLQASGIRVIGIDIDPAMVELARKSGAELTLQRDDAGIENKITNFTEGLGSDAVIIAAASNSLDPINFAGVISRKKGTIVIVGTVPTGFDREPHFYKKELQVKMSCSYGPGRYDPDYEVKGVDYPIAYVRWTEKRNMQAFQELIYSKKIDVSYLTTHTFKLEEVPAAYDMMLSKSEPFIGILIEHNRAKKIDIENRRIDLKLSAMSYEPSAVNIGFIGAGSYAQSHLLPNIPKNSDVLLKGVMTRSGTSSRSVAERFGFDFCTTNEKDITENDDINLVFIATRHDSHSNYVIEALKAEKHVFVEKPLCLTIQQLDEIADLLGQSSKLKAQSRLVVGYNRRFSPLIQNIKKEFGEGPMAMTYRVNAGAIPKDSWIQDPELGGGRIIGEVCHFVDTLTFLSGSLPVSVYANAIADPNNLHDTLNVTMKYQNGSIGTISYLANGDISLPKERIEVFSHGTAVIVDDFKELTIYSKGKKKKKKLISQDKGQKHVVKQFIEAIIEGNGLAELMSFGEIYNTSLVTFKIIESIRTGESIQI